jgi:hypothetical protein
MWVSFTIHEWASCCARRNFEEDEFICLWYVFLRDHLYWVSYHGFFHLGMNCTCLLLVIIIFLTHSLQYNEMSNPSKSQRFSQLLLQLRSGWRKQPLTLSRITEQKHRNPSKSWRTAINVVQGGEGCFLLRESWPELKLNKWKLLNWLEQFKKR